MSTNAEKYVFKSENKFIAKVGSKKRQWRSLKQILTAERALPWPDEAVHYSTINAPPTFKPVKKYSDISGLPAPYMDRHSKLYFSTVDEFATVRSLPMDITAGYLQLRGATIIWRSEQKEFQQSASHYEGSRLFKTILQNFYETHFQDSTDNNIIIYGWIGRVVTPGSVDIVKCLEPNFAVTHLPLNNPIDPAETMLIFMVC